MIKTITSPDNAVESRSSRMWLDEEGIVIAVNKPTPMHELTDALENIDIIKQLSLGKPRPLLVDMTEMKSMAREAREEYASAGANHVVTAIGMVTRSAMGRIVANFFLSFNKPGVPTRLFNNAEAAKKWLGQFR